MISCLLFFKYKNYYNVCCRKFGQREKYGTKMLPLISCHHLLITTVNMLVNILLSGNSVKKDIFTLQKWSIIIKA